jgi:hypothetical protein
MLLFRSEEHIDRWCATWKMDRGGTLSLDNAWQLTQAWFGADRRAPEWRRRTVDEIETLFAQLGLTSEFWRLRT